MVTSVQRLLVKGMLSPNDNFFILPALFALKNQVHGAGFRVLSSPSFPLTRQFSTKEHERLEVKPSRTDSHSKTYPVIKNLLDPQANKTHPVKDGDVSKEPTPFTIPRGFDFPEEKDPDHDVWAEKVIQFYDMIHAHNAAIDARESKKNTR